MNVYRNHTTASLLRLVRVTKPFALVQELLRRGYDFRCAADSNG